MAYGIDLTAAFSDAEEARERENVKNAKWTILHNGKLLPVCNLYDSDGNEIANHFHAFVCVAYDASLSDGNWLTISRLDPGDLDVRRP